MKKILIINGHPKEKSFCTSLLEEYEKGAKENKHEIKILNLRDINFEKYLRFDYTSKLELDKEILEIQNSILWADHLVFAYPIWWASPPALVKIFFEIVFQSGFAFKYQKSNGIFPKWDKLLLNKSARIFSTMDSPLFYYNCFVGDPNFKMLKDILSFCGFRKVEKNYFANLKMSSEKTKTNYLKKAYKIGIKE